MCLPLRVEQRWCCRLRAADIDLSSRIPGGGLAAEACSTGSLTGDNPENRRLSEHGRLHVHLEFLAAMEAEDWATSK